MPRKGEHVKFKKYKNKMKSPFMIYADFELWHQNIMESNIQMSLIQAVIKNMLLGVMGVN